MGSSGLSRVHVFGVRHHSPRSTAMLGALLERVRPQVVLVEGPLDEGPLIDVVVDAMTEPPIAILGYATEGEPRSALWPFAAYSPEYRALRWAAEHGAQARFIDVPVGVSLARDAIEEHGPDEAREDDEPGAEADAPRALDHDPHQRAAEARGLRSFEELWEACFEAPNYTPEQFREAMLAHAALTREPGEKPAPPENPMSADRVRWEHIQRVYELCDRNVSETARRLNMHRRTLQRILAKRAPR